MQIDKRQLSQLSDEVDQLHHESMRTIRDEFGEIHFGDAAKASRDGRRDFMKKAGVGGAVVTAGAVLAPVSSFMPAAWADAAPSDADLAKFAASLELAAVGAYQAALKTGKLSPASVAVGTLFASHHQDHANALNSILGSAAVKAGNKTVLAAFGPKIASAPTEAAILDIAYTIEEAAASTYLYALGYIMDLTSAGALATILPVESQHATVLATVLKKPASDYLIDFLTLDNALSPAKYPA